MLHRVLTEILGINLERSVFMFPVVYPRRLVSICFCVRERLLFFCVCGISQQNVSYSVRCEYRLFT